MKLLKNLIVFSALILLVSSSLFAQVHKGGMAWVSVKSASVKTSTWFFADTKGDLQMGAQVMILQINQAWAEVRSVSHATLSGWTALSNLSSRRIASTATGASASTDEIALAGKGFNQEIENSYKSKGILDYGDVDKTEVIKISRDELYQFVTEGHLITGEP